jgi:uncharacterized protein (TIGR00725 family)
LPPAKRNSRIITVFGSSRPREGHADYEFARALGIRLAEFGFTVCTGGYGGVMEAVSRGAKEGSGHVLAVTAKAFLARANRWVDEEIRVATWQQRLFELIRRGHGYVACKGGTGTLAELAVVWEMLNKRVIRRPKPFVALGTFWSPVIDCVNEVESGDSLIHIAPTPEDAAAYLAEHLLKTKVEGAATSAPRSAAPTLF